MCYNDLINMLVYTFPHLEKEVEVFLSSDGKLCHVLYESILCPYVNNLLQNDSKKELNIVFDFYEKMAMCEDDEVKNLLQVTLLENLMVNKELYKKAEKYMHTNTKLICKSIEKYLQ